MHRTLSICLLGTTIATADPVDLGSRRELLVDDFLVERMEDVELKLHKPEAREVVITCDEPWEGNTSAYYTLFQDGDLYRMYYRGSHAADKSVPMKTHRAFVCYAESRDGIHWIKPKLGLFEFDGSKENNIVWDGHGVHNFAPFLDSNPKCPPESRYKALAGYGDGELRKKKPALQAYQSPDGIHWSLLREEPVITAGAFDSQNIAYFDEVRGEYRAYWRYFTAGSTDENGWKPKGVRAIRTATSKDFLTWENQADLAYGDAPEEQLYTNAVRAYDRAPHLFLGFPTRYQPKHQQVEPVFMTSRDGVNFKRWPEEIIPITAPKDRDGNRSNYMTRGLLQLPSNDRELSVYATEAYYAGPGSRVRRFAYRMDGFVSVHTTKSGEMVTKPITFTGDTLRVNLHSRGSTRFELQDETGTPIPGFALADCAPQKCDEIETTVEWNGGSLKPLNGKSVRLRAVLEDADWYAFRFGE